MPAACRSLTMPLNSSSTPCGSVGRGVGGVGREEAHRVVAPVVAQTAQDEIGLVGERVHGQQLDRGDTQPQQVVDEGRVGQAGIRAAQLGWHAGMQARRALDVHLVDERLREGATREVVCAPVELGVDDDAARHVGCGVAVVAHGDVAPQVGADAVGVEGAVEVHLAVDGAGVGVEERASRGCGAGPRRGPTRRRRGRHTAARARRPRSCRTRSRGRGGAAARGARPPRRRRRCRRGRCRRRSRDPRRRRTRRPRR